MISYSNLKAVSHKQVYKHPPKKTEKYVIGTQTNATVDRLHSQYKTSWLVHPLYKTRLFYIGKVIVQELCDSRGGRPGLSVLTSLLVSVDVKLY